MKNSIILSTTEIQHNVVVKRIPIKTKGRKWTPTIPPYEMQNGEMCFSELPYQPGQVVYVREAWQECAEDYYYKADNICIGYDYKRFECIPSGVQHHKTCVLCEYVDGHILWRSASTMPKEAARLWYKVTEVKAVFDGQWHWEVTMERIEKPDKYTLKDLSERCTFDEGGITDAKLL